MTLVDENERAHWEQREQERGFIRVRIRLLTTEEGGRQGPIADGYRASWDIGKVTESGEWTTTTRRFSWGIATGLRLVR